MEVSAIGMGCEYVWTADEKTVCEVVRAAVDAGVNYFGLFVGTPSTREYYGKALKDVREKVYLAGHLGCADVDGQYVRTRDEALCWEFMQQLYEKLQTNYLHWHGAAADSWFSHLAIEVSGEGTSNGWLEAVEDDVYNKL